MKTQLVEPFLCLLSGSSLVCSLSTSGWRLVRDEWELFRSRECLEPSPKLCVLDRPGQCPLLPWFLTWLQSALKWYRIAAWVTGILLILLTVEIVAKYGFGSEVEMFGEQGAFALVPDGTVQAFNLSQAVLIAHGWFYVVYLFTCFRVWSILRWPFWRFLWLASGGLVPLLSFVIEHFATKTVSAIIADVQGAA